MWLYFSSCLPCIHRCLRGGGCVFSCCMHQLRAPVVIYMLLPLQWIPVVSIYIFFLLCFLGYMHTYTRFIHVNIVEWSFFLSLSVSQFAVRLCIFHVTAITLFLQRGVPTCEIRDVISFFALFKKYSVWYLFGGERSGLMQEENWESFRREKQNSYRVDVCFVCATLFRQARSREGIECTHTQKKTIKRTSLH